MRHVTASSFPSAFPHKKADSGRWYCTSELSARGSMLGGICSNWATVGRGVSA